MAIFAAITFNTAGQAQFAAPSANVKLSYDNRLPFGHAFYLELVLPSGTIRGLGPSAAVAISVPSAAFLQEINVMGIKAWIQAKICPWVRATLAEQLGPYVGAVAAPPPAATLVTADNLTAQMNAAIERDFTFPVGANGLPDLVAKA